MSAPRLIAQAVPCLLNAFPGWKLPVHCRLVADVGATGAVVARAASTTPGVTITRNATAQYTIAFPKCRDIAQPVVICYSAAPETDAAATQAQIDADTAQTGGPLGQFKFHTYNRDDGFDDADPPSGDILDITFWADFG